MVEATFDCKPCCDEILADCNRTPYPFDPNTGCQIVCPKWHAPRCETYVGTPPADCCKTYLDTGTMFLNERGEITHVCCDGEILPIGPPPPPPPICPTFIWEGNEGSGQTGTWAFSGSGNVATFPIDGSSGTLVSPGTPADPSEIYSADIETTFGLTPEACLSLADPNTKIRVRFDGVHTVPGGDIAYEIHLIGAQVVASNSAAGANVGQETQSMVCNSGTCNEFVEFEVTLAQIMAGMTFHTHSLGQLQFPLGEILESAMLTADLSELSLACGCDI